MVKEIWKPIKGYSNKYFVSNLGQIKSLKSNKIRKPELHSDGYLKIKLWRNNKPKSFLIHKLVAKYFLKVVPGKTKVSHIDGNKMNNTISNLEWTTQKEVVERSWKLGKSTLHTSRNVFIYQYSKDEKLIRVFESVVDAAKSVNRSTRSITRVLDGRFHTSAGFIWKYKGVI